MTRTLSHIWTAPYMRLWTFPCMLSYISWLQYLGT